MNVLERVREIIAMPTRIAPIPKDHLPVLVVRDTLEMGLNVPVSDLEHKKARLPTNTIFRLDVNECAHEGLGNQCVNGTSTCTNTIGSYYCTCIAGYSGDGITCNGLASVFVLLHFFFF